jgi:hypothetical protein
MPTEICLVFGSEDLALRADRNFAGLHQIPYCDIVVTDNKAWDVVVNRAHLDTEFNTTVLARLGDLPAYLPVPRQG